MIQAPGLNLKLARDKHFSLLQKLIIYGQFFKIILVPGMRVKVIISAVAWSLPK
jgi:hypothetical protein